MALRPKWTPNLKGVLRIMKKQKNGWNWDNEAAQNGSNRWELITWVRTITNPSATWKALHWRSPSHIPYFSHYKMHLSPQIWGVNGGASYSPNVAYLGHRGRGRGRAWQRWSGVFFPSYFSPLKPRCILWSGGSHSPKNTVLHAILFCSGNGCFWPCSFMFQAITGVNVFILPCWNAVHATESGMESSKAFCFCLVF